LSVLTWSFGLFAVLLLVPAAVLFAQVVLAWLPARRLVALAGKRPPLAVLMPAHDEAAVIADTLASIMPQLQAGDRLLVVADNCDDDTARIAREAGAEVVERRNSQLRGKGYALDFGVRHLESAPPEIVIIVDADCEVEPEAIDWLTRISYQSERPVQALYLMHASDRAGFRQQFAEFAWRVKNWVRPLGYHRLGLPCQLMGTGMAFPWASIRDAKLANANIVEDMKLGVDLAISGKPALFCPEARVSSIFPEAAAAERSQRMRWEHGHLEVIQKEFPRLLGRGVLRGDIRAMALALDLAVPPLALLVLSLFGMCVATGAVAFAGGGAFPLVVAGLGLGLAGVAVLLAWLGWGRAVISFATLLSVPIYVLAKIPLYIRFWTRRQKEWVRTDRD
jgi:cellulose synthase/poly-beta-1,6-N-acetylglucosamine synthase-like glycosyltransferase